jgi:hypothetical protein
LLLLPLLLPSLPSLLSLPALPSLPSPEPSLFLPSTSPAKWAKIKQHMPPATFLLVPVNQKRRLRLVWVDRKRAVIRMYDSLAQKESMESMLITVRNHLLLGKLGWAKGNWELVPEKCPVQHESHSCGAFILRWVKQIVDDGCIEVGYPPEDWRYLVKAALLLAPKQ